MAKRLIPLLDRVLIEKLAPPTKTVGGVLLPETASKVRDACRTQSVFSGGAGLRASGVHAMFAAWRSLVSCKASAYCLVLYFEHERKRYDHLLSSNKTERVRCSACLYMFWKAVGCSRP